MRPRYNVHYLGIELPEFKLFMLCQSLYGYNNNDYNKEDSYYYHSMQLDN